MFLCFQLRTRKKSQTCQLLRVVSFCLVLPKHWEDRYKIMSYDIWYITKHLYTCRSGKLCVLWPLDDSSLLNFDRLGNNNVVASPWQQ